MAHPDLDALLNAVLPFAQQMLTKHGESYPFGAIVNRGGEIALVAAGGSEHPGSQDVIDILVGGFRAQAATSTIRACVVCYDGRVIPHGGTHTVDAICARLEHESGESVAVFLPYHKESFGRVSYQELIASKVGPQVFNTSAG